MIVKEIIKWCSSTYGTKGDAPLIYFNPEVNTFDEKGLYIEEDNCIKVKIASNEEMIKTIIHEWQHYLQSKYQFEILYNMGYDY